MDTNALIVAGLVGIASFLAAHVFKGQVRADEKHEHAIVRLRSELYGETNALRDELKGLVAAVGALTVKVDHLSERMSAPAYPGSGSFLGALSEGVRILEGLRNIGVIRIGAPA